MSSKTKVWGIYGSPRIFIDLKESGVACSENLVARLMRAAQIKSVRRNKRPRYKVGKPAQVALNQLERQFQHDEPAHAWVPSSDSKSLRLSSPPTELWPAAPTFSRSAAD